MLFNSLPFIVVFMPAALAGWYLLAGRRAARQAWLIVVSWIFYGWWDIRFVPVLVGLAIANWCVVVAFASGARRWLLTAGVAMNLLVLGFFKYFNFFADQLLPLVGRSHDPWDIFLPIGISFFIFQKISYLVDLERGDRHIYGFLDYALFVSFFPQLVAGPLVRHNEIIPQMANPPLRADTWENLARGGVLFFIGVLKKVGIADTVAPIADALFGKAAAGAALGLQEAWSAVGAYTLQIYFDFSGYSDMALGLALMFGFRLPINFDAPYRAASIREFWRRWHLTLSRFLRDYVYVPLGGNRVGGRRQALNVLLTMLLGGLWHGANWTFVVWGGAHGAALAVNGAFARRGWRLPWPMGWALTLLFVAACWVLFRSPDFATAARVYAGMLGLEGWHAVKLDNAAVLVLGGVVAVLGPTSQRLALDLLAPRPWAAAAAGVTAAFLLLLIGGRLQNEFIYFQF